MMKASFNKVRLQSATFANSMGLAFAGISLAFGAVSIASISANSAEVSANSANSAEVSAKTSPKSPQLSAAAHGPRAELPDGVYLYGQSPKPNQVGSGYFVFESKQGNVVGALYFPNSSFDCATGTFGDKQLALTVTNSYERTSNPFEIAVERTSSPVASSGTPSVQIGLQGFHKIDAISTNDQRILKVCKADLQKVVR